MTQNQKKMYRILEMIPGITVWGTFVLGVVGSFFFPIVVLFYILVYDLLWMFRIIRFVINIFVAWIKYKSVIATNWLEKAQIHKKFDDIHHVIFLPTYKEELSVIQTTLKSLKNSAYPSNKMIIVLAGEERDGEYFLRNADSIQREFADTFHSLLITVHPKDLEDEIPGKGSNLNWSGKEAQKLIDRLGIPYENVVVSAFDVDTIAHSQYFGYLTHLYLTLPNPTKRSYQPIALYNNNIWEAKAPVRVAAFGTTFWLMNELIRQDRLITFSSHSMSFCALVDVGFWQKDIVTEDSRIFLQCVTHYKGDYELTPMYMPVSMDMVEGETYLNSLGALYRQIRRWAWGVEHFPWLVWNMGRDKAMPLRVKAKYIWHALEGSHSWATAPILIFLLGRLPFYAAGADPRHIAFFQNAPFTIETIMIAANIGVLISAIVSLLLLPPRPKHVPRRRMFTMVFQWLLLPVTFVVFGSIPAVDAQTRLMLGKYLGFNVTEKRRAQVPIPALIEPAS